MAECAVRPVVVVMVLVLAKHGCGVSQVDDEDAVKEFASDAADETFGDRVGSWCPHRCLNDADVERGEHGVEGCGELGVTVPDEEPEAAAGVLEVHEQVTGMLGQPGSGGVGGDAEDVDAAGGLLNNKEDIQPAQRDGVQMEQVTGDDPMRLSSQELALGGSRSAR